MWGQAPPESTAGFQPAAAVPAALPVRPYRFPGKPPFLFPVPCAELESPGHALLTQEKRGNE